MTCSFPGTSDRNITDYVKWNSETSETSCSNASHSCVVYRTRDLQNYDKESRIPFHVALRAYNYGGFYCDVDTDAFYLPSQILSSFGVVYDVIDTVTNDNFGALFDLDYTLSLSKLCMTWQGFEHHEELLYRVAVGSRPELHDVIDFQSPSHSSWHCFPSPSFVPYTTYFLTLYVENSAGSVTKSTDGVIIVDATDIFSALSVNDGIGCEDVKIEEEIQLNKIIPVSDKISFRFANVLHIGQTYTMKVDISSSEVL